MTTVPEMFDPNVCSVVCLALSKFVVMMWEPKIHTTRVNVERAFLEDRSCHGRALDVPSWSSLAPWRWPRGLTWL